MNLLLNRLCVARYVNKIMCYIFSEMETKKSLGFWCRVRNNFFYGLILILPLIATGWLVWVMIKLISGPVSALFDRQISTGFSFVLTLVGITAIGLLAKNFIGRSLIGVVENIILKIPFVNSIYGPAKQIINAFTLSNNNFLSAVLLEYPRKGIWALGFITSEKVRGIKEKNGEVFGADMCSVFVPTTPNPTSGYFIFIKRDELKFLSMSVEDSIKISMSAGVISPGDFK